MKKLSILLILQCIFLSPFAGYYCTYESVARHGDCIIFKATLWNDHSTPGVTDDTVAGIGNFKDCNKRNRILDNNFIPSYIDFQSPNELMQEINYHMIELNEAFILTNPVNRSNSLNLNLGTEKSSKIELLSSAGANLSKSYFGKYEGFVSLNISDISPGIYYVKTYNLLNQIQFVSKLLIY